MSDFDNLASGLAISIVAQEYSIFKSRVLLCSLSCHCRTQLLLAS